VGGIELQCGKTGMFSCEEWGVKVHPSLFHLEVLGHCGTNLEGTLGKEHDHTGKDWQNKLRANIKQTLNPLTQMVS